MGCGGLNGRLGALVGLALGDRGRDPRWMCGLSEVESC